MYDVLLHLLLLCHFESVYYNVANRCIYVIHAYCAGVFALYMKGTGHLLHSLQTGPLFQTNSEKRCCSKGSMREHKTKMNQTISIMSSLKGMYMHV